MSNINYAFLLSFLAGLSTMIGLLLVFIKFKNTNKIVCASLAFAAGVMICVSGTDLLVESISLLRENYNGMIVLILSFLSIFVGIIISMLIDKFLPIYDNYDLSYKKNLFKIGLISMIAIIIHNIPEGIATFISTTKDTSLGISLTLAIALHNIPEGISIGIPIFYSTKSKFKAFLFTFISAMSEPFGAIITYLFLYKFINDTILGSLFSFIAGIMLHISICELIPASKKYGFYKIFYTSFIIGVLVMLIHFIL